MYPPILFEIWKVALIPTLDPFLQGIFMVNIHHFKSNKCTLEFNVHITYNTSSEILYSDWLRINWKKINFTRWTMKLATPFYFIELCTGGHCMKTGDTCILKIADCERYMHIQFTYRFWLCHLVTWMKW